MISRTSSSPRLWPEAPCRSSRSRRAKTNRPEAQKARPHATRQSRHGAPGRHPGGGEGPTASTRRTSRASCFSLAVLHQQARRSHSRDSSAREGEADHPLQRGALLARSGADGERALALSDALHDGSVVEQTEDQLLELAQRNPPADARVADIYYEIANRHVGNVGVVLERSVAAGAHRNAQPRRSRAASRYPGGDGAVHVDGPRHARPRLFARLCATGAPTGRVSTTSSSGWCAVTTSRARTSGLCRRQRPRRQ